MAAIRIVIVATCRKGFTRSHANITDLVDSVERKWPVADAINFHELGMYRFVTMNGLVETPIVPHGNGLVRWMQTVSNGVPTDNLLNLPVRSVAA